MIAQRAVRRFGTPAHLASLPGAPKRPPRRYSQTELRERRRTGLTVGHYAGDWSLAREIADVVRPLAERVAAAPSSARFRLPVAWLAEATHELVGVIVGWIAEADAHAKTAHLANEPGKRKYAMTTLIDLAPRPALPEISRESLDAGSWAAVLTALADDIDGPLSALLGRAYPPNANELRGQTSRSERLARLLAQTLDRAALELERRLDTAQDHPEPTTSTTPTDPRAVLAEMGVTP
ncbi:MULTISPECIES: hypothetical protein [Mycolicibacter]|uniref:hypothetical protein n=1 Tax=Mycolicibacter TaxID=1073531 RepID=UPI00122CEB78|nr:MULTISPECIES: hypothetical protein [Mycolicibacter]KAA1431096.1 hypothetical protein F0402_10615 [Mycolicibacter arupensis]ULP48679.1 hypothetical protein MJO54_06130 [Mycolicibacter virginiensis]